MRDPALFMGFFRGIVSDAVAAIRASGPETCMNDRLAASLERGLTFNLSELAHPALFAQFKLVEDKIPFQSYVAALDDPGMQLLLMSRYPVLARFVSQHIANWHSSVVELLRRFQADQGAIGLLLGSHIGDLQIERIRFGMGDAHRGGRTVALLQLTGGLRIMYKPRNLSLDEHYRQLASDIGETLNIELRLPANIARPDYGWVEYIERRDCTSHDEIQLFYRRLGATLALLHCLNATDFHYENLIAHGPHPMLVDLETLLTPHMPIIGTETNEGFDNSVLRTGLLPSRFSFDGREGPVIGGISNVAGQKGPVERLVLVEDEKGIVTFQRERGEMVGGQNVPTLHGETIADVTTFAPELEGGFADLYCYVVENKQWFIKRVEEFRGDESRVLFRDTLVYSHLLDEARHPTILLSEARLDEHLATLRPQNADFRVGELIVDDEIARLRGRDVPMFSCRVGDRDLMVDGETRDHDFFVKDGLADARDRVAEMGPSDLKRQLWVIRTSLKLEQQVSARREKGAPVVVGTTEDAKPADEDVCQHFKRLARLIATRVRGEIHEDGDHASWLVMRSIAEDNSRFSVSTAFYDLYAGMPGEISFLTHMDRLDPLAGHGQIAEKAWRFLQRRLDEASYSVRPLGLFAGWGSVLFTAAALARWHGAREYAAYGVDLLDRVKFEELIAVDRSYSLLKGSAGFIVACSALHRETGSNRAVELAEAAYRHLLAHRHHTSAGLCWRVSSERPLSGLSHGSAGIAVAFAELYAITGDRRHREACLAALAFERTLYVSDAKNWLDQRDVARRADRAFGLSWAHGAPGIGISRLAILRTGLRSDQILEEADVATETSLRGGLTGELAVVSGDFGRVELPLLFGETVSDKYRIATDTMLRDLADKALDRICRQEPGRPTPMGLLGGFTGVGYQCLRIATPNQVPSLIGLDYRTSAGASADRRQQRADHSAAQPAPTPIAHQTPAAAITP